MADSVLLRLVPVEGPEPWRIPGHPVGLRLEEGKSYRIGRVEDADIRLDHLSVGRNVLTVTLCKGAILVSDLGSGGGSCLNGQDRPWEAPLSEGDRLTIGELTFRVEIILLKPFG